MVQTYGERLEALREDRGLTREQLAEKAGLAPYVVGFLENGGFWPTPIQNVSLSNALGIDPKAMADLAPLAAVPQERAAASPANARSLHQKAMDVLEKQLALLEKDNLLNSEAEAACRIIDSMISVLYCMPDEGGVSDG